MSPLRVVPPFPIALWFSCWFSKPRLLWAHLSCDLRVGVPTVVSQPLALQGEVLCSWNPSTIVDCCTWFFFFQQDLVSTTSTHLNAGSFSFIVEALFIQFSGLFRRKLLHLQLCICCVCRRRWTQNPPIVPSWIPHP